jgi:beta-mannosidase
MPATMPGTIHHHLQKLRKIPDPYYGRNELGVLWVDEQDWELRKTVRAGEGDCRSTRQELIFDGLDTVATVFLNGKKVGQSVNMFRQVVCNVAGVLVPGDNEVSVLLRSPTAYAKRQADRHQRVSKRADFAWQTGETRRQAREWIRKVQCHFGWDWGVFLATSGIWQPARLECSDAPRIASLKLHQTHRSSKDGTRSSEVDIEVTAYLEAREATSGVLTVHCAGEEAKVKKSLRAGENRVKAKLTLRSPKLWWPAGEGEQHLYDLSASFQDQSGASVETGRRIGIRTLELVTGDDRAPDGSKAQSFFFRVNGRDIYARGADWIPVDQFVDRATPSVYRHLLTSTVEAHMNMVRVWGGGWYEQEVFYDLCDELGILVWQDFMMACALYPDTRDFIAELSAEAKYQVRRLHHRASLALWCGDNENTEAVWNWWKAHPDFKKSVATYVRTMSALRRVCQAEDTTRSFWISSPGNNEFAPNPEDPNRGDVHYWKVWHGRQPFSNYLTVRPRFVSEFGFQSFPEPRTVRSVVPKDQRNPSSRVMEHHQRSHEGNMLITNTMAREMPIPKDFDAFCWVSQINQAMAIRTAVEHWRRLKPWCMGALYWQLNDLWPVASWSSIDYHGRWKVLQHAAARFFAPLLASVLHEKDRIEVFATSDIDDSLDLRGELDVVTWSGKRIARAPLRARLKPQESRLVRSVSLASLLAGRAEPHEICCFVRLTGERARADNFATLVPWKWVTLPKPRPRAALRLRANGLELVVRTDVVTPFFHAEIEGAEGHFRGDWQVLRPGRTYVLPWAPAVHRGAQPLPLSEARRNLRTQSLYDLYDHGGAAG